MTAPPRTLYYGAVVFPQGAAVVDPAAPSLNLLDEETEMSNKKQQLINCTGRPLIVQFEGGVTELPPSSHVPQRREDGSIELPVPQWFVGQDGHIHMQRLLIDADLLEEASKSDFYEYYLSPNYGSAVPVPQGRAVTEFYAIGD